MKLQTKEPIELLDFMNVSLKKESQFKCKTTGQYKKEKNINDFN